jgi:methionine-rich copper-binding protein CopC
MMIKDARPFAKVRWVQQGFRRSPGVQAPEYTQRNVMGQLDGTAKPRGTEIDPAVWNPDGSTTLVVRRVRAEMETWDKLSVTDKELAVGRRMDSGAPLSGALEHDKPDFAVLDETGLPKIPDFSHVTRTRVEDPRLKTLRRPYKQLRRGSGRLRRSGLWADLRGLSAGHRRAVRAHPATPRREGPAQRMDHPDRVGRLRGTARLRRGRLDRRAGTGVRRLAAVTAAVLTVMAPGVPAWAHAQLTFADPAKDLILSVAPVAVTLGFNERLRPDFTTIVVSDAAQQRVAASPAVVDDKRATVTLTGTFTNGIHTVAYRVVSVDVHTVQGSYPFTLADPNLPPAAQVTVSAAAAPAATAETGGSAGVLLGSGAAILLLAALGGRLYLSGRRRSSTPAGN